MMATRPDRLLRYWAVNMSLARATGQATFPGFGYTDEEWQRILTIAASVPRMATLIWLAATVLLYLLAAAAFASFDFGLVAGRLWPDPASAPEWAFLLLLASTALVALSAIMPLSIAAGGWCADILVRSTPPAAEPGDGALAAKIRHQFFRMAAVSAALMVPAGLILAALGPAADAVVGWLRVSAIGMAIAASMFAALSRHYHALGRRSTAD